MLSPSSLNDFEWSWESGEVPLDWKLVNVVPVFKKGKNNDLETPGLSISLQYLVKYGEDYSNRF